MNHWRYIEVMLVNKDGACRWEAIGAGELATPSDAVLPLLNQLGQEGWELVSVTPPKRQVEGGAGTDLVDQEHFWLKAPATSPGGRAKASTVARRSIP